MRVERNSGTRWCNQSCSTKAASITYSECVFVALGIQLAMRMRHIVVCVLSDCRNIFPHYVTNGAIFEKESYGI